MEEERFFYYLTPMVSEASSRRTWDDEDLSYYSQSTRSIATASSQLPLEPDSHAHTSTTLTYRVNIEEQGQSQNQNQHQNQEQDQEQMQELTIANEPAPTSTSIDHNSNNSTSTNGFHTALQPESVPPTDTTMLLLPPMNGSIDYSKLRITPANSRPNSRHGLAGSSLNSSRHSTIVATTNTINRNNDANINDIGIALTPKLERGDSFFKPLSRKSSSFFEPISRRASSFVEPFNDHTGAPKSVIAGLFNLTVVGTLIGIIMPQNDSLPTPWYRVFSSVTGYCYFIFWCASFYPQVVMNFQRKSTEGLSIDYSVINFFGYICYTAYTASFYWNESVKEMYRERHQTDSADGQESEITVESNDVAFAIHSLVMSIIWLIQLEIYGGFKKCRKEKKRIVSRPIKILIYLIVGSCTFYALGILYSTRDHEEDSDHWNLLNVVTSANSPISSIFNWLDFLYYLSFLKVVITIAKYIPQVLLNMKRKSCVGWNIWNILLDISGGILSLMQLVGDAIDLNDLSSISGNSAKLGLSAVSIFFDVIFLLQHYVWYPNHDDPTTHKEDKSPKKIKYEVIV